MYPMSPSSKNPRLIDRLSKEIPSRHDNRYTLNHKKTWLALSDNGIWPCEPQELYKKLQDLAKLDEYQPRGDRLLFLRSRDKFTLLPSLRPGRPEEALERLIVQSNAGTMYGQMPIRGGKESVDIVHLRNKVGTFIELKPWNNKDSPLYAILEGLKNLAIFDVLKNKGHQRCSNFSSVNLAVLAPLDYYRDYHLIDERGQLRNYSRVKEFIEAIASHFQTRVQLFGLNWKEEDLMNVCKDIQPKAPKENVVVSVSEYPPIEALYEKNWIEII
jgi:hypothetical protein